MNLDQAKDSGWREPRISPGSSYQSWFRSAFVGANPRRHVGFSRRFCRGTPLRSVMAFRGRIYGKNRRVASDSRRRTQSGTKTDKKNLGRFGVHAIHCLWPDPSSSAEIRGSFPCPGDFMPAGHDPYAALRHRDYRLLLAGTVVTSAASQMQSVAVGWELYGRTGSTAALGLVGLAQFLPVLLLSIPAGQAADHLNRKALYVAAQMLAALASAGLAVLSWQRGPVPVIYLCLLLTGSARAFTGPARWSLLPPVVPAN